MIPIIFGNAHNGRLTIPPEEIRRVQPYLQTLEGEVSIAVQKRKRHRSNPQNRYMWGVVIKLISDHTGFTPTETHEVLKAKFLKTHVKFNDREYEVIRSTTSLNTLQFELYLAQIREWASLDLSLSIPDPNECGGY